MNRFEGYSLLYRVAFHRVSDYRWNPGVRAFKVTGFVGKINWRILSTWAAVETEFNKRSVIF